MDKQDLDAIRRKVLFVPCETQEALHNWIKEFLQVDLPDTIVDPDSTCSPMGMVWELYERARKNDDENFNQVLAYASRDSFKTLCAAVVEVLCVVHLGRSVAHMAAIESQAKKAQSYVKKFFGKPYLRDFVVGDNARTKEVARYHDPKTGENINEAQYQALAASEQAKYEEHRHYIVIVIGTLSGANSEHVPFMVVDEAELCNPAAYEESKMIPSVYEEKLPITLITSTRKFSHGLVQKEINEADESGLQIRHWNIIDVTQKCPESRHQPGLPIIDAYVDDGTLQAVSAEEFEGLSPEKKEKFQRHDAFTGCLKNCKIFAACKGRLATKQKAHDSKAKVKTLLKPVADTQNKLRRVALDRALAQLLCRRPSTVGAIYPTFDKERHMLTASQIAQLVTAEPQDPNMTKMQLIELLKSLEVRFIGGMDFGYTHNWATPIAAIDGNRCFVIDCLSAAELMTEQQVELAKTRVLHYQAKIAADPENPQAILSFKKAGFKIAPVKKGAGSVLGGIEIVRELLGSGIAPPRLFILKDDPDGGCELLAQRLASYHWKLGADGKPTGIPDEEDDDEADALRYMVMSHFGKGGKVTAPRDTQATVVLQPQVEDWMKREIANRLGTPEAPGADPRDSKIKSGSGFFFDGG